MKKVYIPTKDELQKLQSLGVNIYNYMIAKTIESLVIADTIYEEEDMIEYAYDNLDEFPEILYAICRMYPERIECSERASKDIELCYSMVDNLPDTNKKIYGLDALSYFDLPTKKLFDRQIVSATARQLSEQLLRCPKYRFDYKEPSELLDAIFACEIPTRLITQEAQKDFIIIDPIYAVKLDSMSKKDSSRQDIIFNLRRSLIKLKNRYRLNSYNGIDYFEKDILNNPDERVKKLIRTLEHHKQNYQ